MDSGVSVLTLGKFGQIVWFRKHIFTIQGAEIISLQFSVKKAYPYNSWPFLEMRKCQHRQ